jgi:hypothetical protein
VLIACLTYSLHSYVGWGTFPGLNPVISMVSGGRVSCAVVCLLRRLPGCKLRVLLTSAPLFNAHEVKL